MDGGPLKDRPTADDFCVAMVFDARGWAYCSLKSLHMPELGVTKWQENTLTCADAWAARLLRWCPIRSCLGSGDHAEPQPESMGAGSTPRPR